LNRQVLDPDGVHHQADECTDPKGSQPERHKVISTGLLDKGDKSKNEGRHHDHRGPQPGPLGLNSPQLRIL
jgi:hypothetical protein